MKRTASGAISRAASAYNEHELGTKVRMKKFGLSEADARDQKAGSVIGRLRLLGLLTEAQYQAGVLTLKRYQAFQGAVKSPGLRTGRGEAGAVDSEAYEAWYQEAVEKWRGEWKGVPGVIPTLQAASGRHKGGNLYAALDYLLLRDEDYAHLRADLRQALTILVPLYGLSESALAA